MKGVQFFPNLLGEFLTLFKKVDDTWFRQNEAIELLYESDNPEASKNDNKSEIESITDDY